MYSTTNLEKKVPDPTILSELYLPCPLTLNDDKGNNGKLTENEILWLESWENNHLAYSDFDLHL